jgi:hypothetical protein
MRSVSSSTQVLGPSGATSSQSSLEQLRALIDQAERSVKQPYANQKSASQMQEILREVLRTGSVYTETIGQRSWDSIRNWIYQSISYLRSNVPEFHAIMGHIVIKPTLDRDGWTISARRELGIVYPEWRSELTDFLQSAVPSSSFVKSGLLLKEEDFQFAKDNVAKYERVVMSLGEGHIFVRFFDPEITTP